MLTYFNNKVNNKKTVHIQELHYDGIISSSQLSSVEQSLAHIIDTDTAHSIVSSVRNSHTYAQQVKGTAWFSAYGGYVHSKKDHLGVHLELRLARATIAVPLLLRFLVNSRSFAKKYLSEHLQTTRHSDLSIQTYESPISHPNRLISLGTIATIVSASFFISASILISLFVKKRTPHFNDNRVFSRNFKF